MNFLISALVAVLVLAGCASTSQAPVASRQPVVHEKPLTTTHAAPEAPQAGYYTVKKGDTLYAIALDNGQDYKDIAAWNNLENPNLIRVGQSLRVAPPEGAAPVAEGRPVMAPVKVERVESRPLTAPVGNNTETFKREPRGGKQAYSDALWAQVQQGTAKAAEAAEAAAATAESPVEKPADKPADKPAPPPAPAPAPAVVEEGIDWAWPAQGKLTGSYSEGGNKGIDIAGKTGQPVLAAANGKVTLVSSALRGYGNLVVIKHNTSFLSVYAHNSKILVKEGQAVTKGMQIAEVGSSDADQPKVHFEIRKQGKPVDPMQFLPRR